jgi:hypothetical protein
MGNGGRAVSKVKGPPVLEALGLAEAEHNPKNNRMRAK